uniref:Uncharacterized protein n=1 Tax=Romanomermis culicivorax TaxID=13658 RepID=A0A915K126_ROMCU
MTTLTKKESYTVQRETTGYDTGLTKQTVLQVMDALPISQEFRREIQQSLNNKNCEFLVDNEFKFDKNSKTLSYMRVGYTKMRPNTDNYLLIRSLLVVRYPDLPEDTQKFLECAAKYGADEKRCPMSQNLSVMDWISYKIWKRAKAITNFMVDYQLRYQAVENHLQQLKNYLPADYRKPPKCDAKQPEGCLGPNDERWARDQWRAKVNRKRRGRSWTKVGRAKSESQKVAPRGAARCHGLALFSLNRKSGAAQYSAGNCDAIVDPKLGHLTHLAQTANSSDVTKNELKKIRALLKNDVLDRAVPGIFCQTMDEKELEKLLGHLIQKEFMDQESVREIRQKISSKDELVLDVLFNKKDDKKEVYFSRIFILAEVVSNDKEYVMGGVFLQLTVKNEIRILEQDQTCDDDSPYCFMTSIEFPTNDVILKKYIAKKAVDSLVNQQQPGKSGKESWWKEATGGKNDDGNSEEQAHQEEGKGQQCIVPQKLLCLCSGFRSLYEAQSSGFSQALTVQDALNDKKTAYPDLLDGSGKVIPLPNRMLSTRGPGIMFSEDKDLEALKKRGYQFWVQRGYLDLYSRYLYNLTQAQIDEANKVAGKFRLSSYSERTQAGVILDLAVEKLKVQALRQSCHPTAQDRDNPDDIEIIILKKSTGSQLNFSSGQPEKVVEIWQSSKMIKPDEAETLKLTLDGQGTEKHDNNFISERGKGEFIYTRVGYIKLLDEDNEKHGTMIYVLHTFSFNVPIEIKAVPTKKCYAWGLFCETKIDMVPQDPKDITLSEQDALKNYMMLRTADDYNRQNTPYVKYLIKESDRYSPLLPANLTATVKNVEQNPGKDPEDVAPVNPIDVDHLTV